MTFARIDAVGARQQREIVAGIHRDAYAKRIASGDQFNEPEPFMARFDNYSSNPRLDLVIAYDDAEPVGQIWGWPVRSTSPTWDGLDTLDVPEPRFTEEDGTRTFALSEIMVRQSWAGHGIAHAMHDELLSRRAERRAMLLVDPENSRAYNAYTSWGWYRVGRLLPSWPNAPYFDVLILDLPLTRDS
ncbi:GNAT family N-acetyltransferase [Actinomadura sp. KC216]|nr:GNAT family N-acetyltransferase [Actinomadura sp. KC216]